MIRLLPSALRSASQSAKQVFRASRTRITPSIKPTGALHSITFLLATFSTMSTSDASSSYNSAPVKSLVTPGNCQFGDEFVSVSLVDRHTVSSTSTVFRFGVPDTTKPLNLSTCACILAKYDDDKGEAVVRPYTPISTNDLIGSFDLLVKNYGPEANMSNYMHQMKVGDQLAFKHIAFNVKIQAPFEYKNIVMIAGGTGITPIIQALHAILGDKDSKINVTLLYGSRVKEDILAQEMLDRWASEYPDQFKLIHVLSHEPADSGWKGGRGYINKAMMEEHAAPASTGEDTIIFVCGPPPMYNALCGPRTEQDKVSGLLADMGYTAEQVYKF